MVVRLRARKPIVVLFGYGGACVSIPAAAKPAVLRRWSRLWRRQDRAPRKSWRNAHDLSLRLPWPGTAAKRATREANRMLKPRATSRSRGNGVSSATMPAVGQQLESITAAERAAGHRTSSCPVWKSGRRRSSSYGSIVQDDRRRFRSCGNLWPIRKVWHEAGVSIPQEVQRDVRDARAGELPRLKISFRIGKREYKCRAFLVQSKTARSGSSCWLFI